VSFDDSEAPALPEAAVLAGYGARVIGIIIDQVIAIVPVAIGAVAAGFRPNERVDSDTLLWLNVAAVLVLFVYQTVMVGLFGRTVGKIVTRTRVVRTDTGGPVGWFASVQRALVTAVAGALPEISLLLAAVVYGAAWFSPRRQGIHDRAAGTIVVSTR
jgi:uncharacterized RDD family membrane protein YckC